MLHISFVLPDGREVEAAGFAPQFSERFEKISGYLDGPDYIRDVAEGVSAGGGETPGVFAVLEKAMEKKFFYEGASHGAPEWRPLTLRYAAWKLANYGVLPIGVLTGAMQASFLDSDAGDAVRLVGGRTITFGSSVEYAEYFDAIRPLMDFTDDEVRNDVLRQYHAVAVLQANAAVERAG